MPRGGERKMENIIDFFNSTLGILASTVTLLGGTVLGITRNFMKQKQTQTQVQKQSQSQVQKQSQTIVNNITVDRGLGKDKNNFEDQYPLNRNEKHEIDRNGISEIKNKKHILFIDDEKFGVVNILKSAGWKNVVYKNDIINLDESSLQIADIIFVDINGVGKKLSDKQGLGLAVQLKGRYPEKKIVIYSAEVIGDRFEEGLRKVDWCMPKNAEPIQFINVIEQLLAK